MDGRSKTYKHQFNPANLSKDGWQHLSHPLPAQSVSEITRASISIISFRQQSNYIYIEGRVNLPILDTFALNYTIVQEILSQADLRQRKMLLPSVLSYQIEPIYISQSGIQSALAPARAASWPARRGLARSIMTQRVGSAYESVCCDLIASFAVEPCLSTFKFKASQMLCDDELQLYIEPLEAYFSQLKDVQTKIVHQLSNAGIHIPDR
jgi:hypothetical protein